MKKNINLLSKYYFYFIFNSAHLPIDLHRNELLQLIIFKTLGMIDDNLYFKKLAYLLK